MMESYEIWRARVTDHIRQCWDIFNQKGLVISWDHIKRPMGSSDFSRYFLLGSNFMSLEMLSM